MFTKLGRGRGGAGGAGKRPPTAPQRPAVKGGPRGPMAAAAAARNRAAAAAAAPAPAREEGFSLVPGQIDFGAIIKLTPDIVEEIRRVEEKGGSASIRFGANPKNSAENIIEVGGKEFKFTWAQELGDLCDIYEEQKSGEDGQGLLAECGSAWRKLNVERILDESTKNHVKMRSEEADRKSRSRKAIVLDPANPSMKNQVKSMAAASVDGSNRRMNWRKEPLPKKQKVESSHGPPKIISKSGISSNICTKGKQSISSPSPPHRAEGGTLSSPFGVRKPSIIEDINDPLNLNREDVGNLEKGMPRNIVHEALNEENGQKCAIIDEQMDLRNILITLLSKNPKGMTLKALEKAVGEAIPKSAKTIETVVKTIATFQAPGKYLLKPGVELGTSKTLVSESGSSPESARDDTSVFESLFVETATSEKNEQQFQLSSKLDETESSEKIGFNHNDRTQTSERNVNNDSEARACSSSGTGSDSDSDSSDSDSDSRSRSSSDSGSDGSSSSKEGSDVEVDIMTSDDEGDQKNEAVELISHPSPRECTAFDEEHEQIDIVGIDQEVQDASPLLDLNDSGRGRDGEPAIDVTEDFHMTSPIKPPESSNTEAAKCIELDAYQTNSRLPDKKMPISPDPCEQSEREKSARETISHAISEIQTMAKDRITNEHSEISDRPSKSKSKRASNPEYSQEKPGSAKMSKSVSSTGALSSDRNMGIGSQKSSLDERGRSGSSNTAPDMHPSPDFWNGSGLDTEQLGSGASAPNGRMKTLGSREKSSGRDENVDANEKCPVRNVWESPAEDKFSSTPDSYKRRYVEKFGAGKDNQDLSHVNKFEINKSSAASGKAAALSRELSDLELGELREPSSGEETARNQQFDRKDSAKPSGIATDSAIPDTTKGGTTNAHSVPKKQSPANLRNGIRGNQDGFNRRVPVEDFMDSTRQQQRTISSHNQQLSRADPTDTQAVFHTDKPVFSRADPTDTQAVFHTDKPVEVASKNEIRIQGMGLENHVGALKNVHTGITLQKGSKHAGRLGNKNVKESKPQRSNVSRGSIDRSNNGLLMENGCNGRIRKEPSSDEDNSFYAKYDKDNPELKGPIKDISQYEEYVQEYREKYVHYCSLNKSLGDTQNEFLQRGNDLKDAKERDMEEYRIIQEELKEMYMRYGEKHKRQKKIFNLLHEELKNVKQKIKDFAQGYSKE